MKKYIQAISFDHTAEKKKSYLTPEDQAALSKERLDELVIKERLITVVIFMGCGLLVLLSMVCK
jgi:hypothetical protein